MLAFTGMDTFILDDDELLQSAANVCQKNGITFVQGSGHRKATKQDATVQSLLDKDYEFIHSKKGIQLRINRSIQIEGAFGTVKGNYEYRRVRHKGKENVEKELLFMAFGFNLRKYRSRRDTDRLQQHYLEKEETHAVAC